MIKVISDSDLLIANKISKEIEQFNNQEVINYIKRDLLNKINNIIKDDFYLLAIQVHDIESQIYIANYLEQELDIKFIDITTRQNIFGKANKNKVEEIGIIANKKNNITKSLSFLASDLLLNEDLFIHLTLSIEKKIYPIKYLAHSNKYIMDNDIIESNTNIVIIGDIDSLLELQNIYPRIFVNSLFIEPNDRVYINGPNKNLKLLHNLITTIANDLNLEIKDQKTWESIIFNLLRYSESNNYINLDISYIKRVLLSGKENNNVITHYKIDDYFKNNHFYNQSTFLEQQFFIEQDIIKISTSGKKKGQVNGLVWVEYSTNSLAYGSTIRISSLLNTFEGTLNDIDTLSNLSGDFSVRAHLICDNLLRSLSEEEIKFSGAVVTEQLYNKIDGDSATMATFCSLASSISNIPIKQNIAITGAMDQQGNSLAVGGLNEKIEAFYYTCKSRGLDGSHAVIIPSTNETSLQLIPEVIDAIKKGKFNIYTVDNISEAFEILTDNYFMDENTDNNIFTNYKSLWPYVDKTKNSFISIIDNLIDDDKNSKYKQKWIIYISIFILIISVYIIYKLI